MILVYFPDNRIHQHFFGFGEVTTINGTLHIDGRDTTTCAADVSWKYAADQQLEQDETGYLRDADYYDEVTSAPSLQDQIDTILELM